METQMQQISKKNKVIVPFYTPPSRLYGQTPAEIIKEARAAVMSPSAIGIKPVFTSRPFTPKEKERTLFGNVKKRKDRPPSAFSLKNIQNQEPRSRLKLPSIEVVAERKTYSKFHYTHNLSLDNLTEDYDAEALEEVGEINVGKLPNWKKSHSCPKEGRMVKAASFNELSHRPVAENTNQWTDFTKTKNQEYKFQKVPKPDLSYQNERLNENQYDTESSISPIFGDSLAEDSNNKTLNFYQHLDTGGAGDYKSQKSKESSKVIRKKLEEHVSSYDKSNEAATKPEDGDKSEAEIKKNESKTKNTEISQEIKKKSETQELSEEKDKANEKKEVLEKEQKNNKLDQQISSENENITEKSTETEFKSDYLTAFKDGYNNSYSVKQPETVPLEILELYETAKYYGIDVDDRGHAKGSSITTDNKKTAGKTVEDYFGEKSNDYLNQLKENFKKTEDKIKILNGAIEKANEKLFPKSETKSSKTSSDGFNFVMNNKKRYHMVRDKGEAKEKAYKKWNNKQLMGSSLASPPQTSDKGWDLFWKNSYFRSSDEDARETGGDRQETLENLKRLVNRITGFIKIGYENSEIYETTSLMYNLIKNSSVCLDVKFKENILKALYLYADNENPEVLLSLARILLYLKVNTSLSVAFKMIFKVARFDANDPLFLNEENILELFLDGIGRSSPLDSAESCIYGYGALKFLTMNHNILSRILHMGALDLMTLHLKMINTAHIENGKVGEQTQHALFQLTGILRHVAAGEGALPLFLTTNCITIMCKTLQLFCKDDDIVTNISRTLSLLSTDENVTQVLMSVENILTTIVDLLERYKENDKILIRLSYCLGNIVEHSDLARVQLSRSDASLTVLLNILKHYIDKDLEISMKENVSNQKSEELTSETVDDIIVKMIRIIANMSMNPIVGSNLSPTSSEKKSLRLSQLLSVLLMRKDPGKTLLATLGCLNNISYYCNGHSVLIDITQGVERVIELPSEDCQAEAARVLGNLTRHKEIRELIYNTGGVDQLSKLLTSQDQEVVRCASGALVNMMLDSDTRKHFVEAHGIDKLVKCLEIFSGDWSLAALAARAIWNSCADDLSSVMVHNNVEHLINILANSLEEENWNDGDAQWEEFASIATDLLERINSHLEST